MPLGISKRIGSFRGKKQPERQDSGGSSLGSCDPDMLHSLPIGGELKVDDKGNVTATTPPSSDQDQGRTEPSSPRSDGSFSNSEDEEAHSFDSIDTISERSSHHEEDVEAEKHHRMKKLLKYSQWIKKRTEGEPKEEGESRSVLALERKMARQEEKLDKLCARKP